MRWIDDEAGLAEVIADLRDAETYFLDTEFESTKRQTRLSVVQVGRGEEIYLIDALALNDLQPLGEVLARPSAQWVLHAGLQDVELLLERFRRKEPPRLFDTQIAWALVGPEASVSLSYLQFRLLGLRSMKTHQADDWLRRPLPQSQLEYAAADIAHLPELYAALRKRLTEMERLGIVNAACREALWPSVEPLPDLDLGSFRHAWQLEPNNQAALQALITWYNRLPGRDRIRAPAPKTLLAIASRLPKTGKDLMRIKGVPIQLTGRPADELARAMNDAAARARLAAFEQIDPVPYATFEELMLEAWLGSMRAVLCAELAIAPELLFPPRNLRAYKAKLLETRDAHCLLDATIGWRKEVLTEPLGRFAARTALPS
jgi:ribonuclease D